jgi:hypothetical protein
MNRFVLACALSALTGTAGSVDEGRAASPTDKYIQRFLVGWSGGGSALLDLKGSPWSVYCHLAPSAGDNSVTLSGGCRLKYLFFVSRSIEAKLKYEAGSDSYSGTYSVDGGPPALLTGRRSGDDLTVNVRWPMPVNGHLQAIIKIFNDGRLFTLKTIDPIGVDGTPITTSDLTFVAQ